MSGSIDDTTLALIEEEMRGDGVWIDPAFARANDISASDEAFLEQTVAGAEHADMKVVLVEIDRDDPLFQGRFSNLSAWLHDSVGGDATYVGFDEYTLPQLSVAAFGDQPETSHAADIATREHPDDLVDAVGRLQELLDDGSAPDLWEQIPRDERYPWTADDGPFEGLGDWVEGLSGTAWLGVGVAVLAAVAAGVVWVRSRRPQTAFVLPTAVLRSVRAAEDRQVQQQADREVLALGEALGAQQPAPESLDTWQQALDHYDAARSVLDHAGSPADVVGALVLARRGDSARASAVAGEPGGPWQPPMNCYFNPLHEGRTERVTWKHEERSVSVPACAACATQVRAGREPDDVLDFIQGDSTVHYYRLDIGAWSGTGYGSVEPDLIAALRRNRRRRGLARLRP
ncbi:hypothetical protein [Nocardioides gilvus]|uniref:hypothetical protein n=1 Tax=Nocardioides gilvus TaxID=1735589 RepID=UPI000D7458FC|nr:hypothetical protein [Nocardioides gilvus]